MVIVYEKFGDNAIQFRARVVSHRLPVYLVSVTIALPFVLCRVFIPRIA